MLDAFLQTLDGHTPEEIVWTADLEYWFAGRRAAGTLDPKLRTEKGYLEFCQHFGIMPYYWYENFWTGESVYNGIDVTEQQDDEKTVQEWTPRLGTLRLESAFCAQSASSAITKYPVQTGEDLKVLLHILENRRLVPANLDNYCERSALWARYDGLPSLALPRSPLPALFVEWTGLENGIYLLMDHPDLMQQAMSYLAEQEKVIIEALCELAPPLVHFPDNLTSETFTGLFDERMAGHYRRRIEALHSAGVHTAVHLDGTVRGLLPKLAAVGFDAIEALTPQPVGDVDVEDMRTLAGNDRVTLWGGLPGAMFAPPFTWDDVQAHAEKLLASWQGRPFVVGVADQIPANGEIEYCRQLADFFRQRTAPCR